MPDKFEADMLILNVICIVQYVVMWCFFSGTFSVGDCWPKMATQYITCNDGKQAEEWPTAYHLSVDALTYARDDGDDEIPIREDMGKLGILTLYVLIFSEGTKKLIFIFHIMPPHWHGWGSWNSSSSETGTYLFYIISIIGADVLAMQGARVSATMILTWLNRDNSVPPH